MSRLQAVESSRTTSEFKRGFRRLFRKLDGVSYSMIQPSPRLTRILIGLLGFVVLPVLTTAEPVVPDAISNSKPSLFHADFESDAIGVMPQEYFAINGEFSIVAQMGSQCLMLAGMPVMTGTLLCGPDRVGETSFRARIYGLSRGRRYPRFGIGLHGVRGHVIRVVPSHGHVELVERGEVRLTKPYVWTSGVWTWLRLDAVKGDGDVWWIRGKAWPANEHEPSEWLVEFKSAVPATRGRFSLWGTPYSEEDLLFDDLEVQTVTR